jgi:hypothetical protein
MHPCEGQVAGECKAGRTWERDGSRLHHYSCTCEKTEGTLNAELPRYLARVHVGLQGGSRLLQAVDRQAFCHAQLRFVVALMDDAMGLPRARRPFVIVDAASGKPTTLAHKPERRHRR